MQITLNWQSAVNFEVTSESGHSISVDGPPDLGGVNAGMRPMELMLMSIGSCAATDVVHILRKARVAVASCQVEVNGTRATEEPQVFTDIHLKFVVSGTNLTEAKLARAIDLSADKYCSASILMRRAGVNVSHEYELVDSAVAS